MGRKVFITSDMSVDEKLVEVAEQKPQAALFWPWLLTAFDDWGRAEAAPKRLKAKVFPAITAVTSEDIAEALQLFTNAGLIIMYEVGGKPYMAIPPEKWFKYQTHIRREKRGNDRSRHPAPPNISSARVRESARECAEPRAVAADCIPSPSPSTLPPFHPSDTSLISISDAGQARAIPSAWKATAQFFLGKVGRDTLSDEEFTALDNLNRKHVPSAVQSQILKAVDRYRRQGHPLSELTLTYIWESMQNYSTKKPSRKEPKTRASPVVGDLTETLAEIRRMKGESP